MCPSVEAKGPAWVSAAAQARLWLWTVGSQQGPCCQFTQNVPPDPEPEPIPALQMFLRRKKRKRTGITPAPKERKEELARKKKPVDLVP